MVFGETVRHEQMLTRERERKKYTQKRQEIKLRPKSAKRNVLYKILLETQFLEIYLSNIDTF